MFDVIEQGSRPPARGHRYRPKRAEWIIAGWVEQAPTSLAYFSSTTRWSWRSVQRGQNGLGGFGPDEGFGAGIVLGEISIDGGLQVGDRVEDAAANAPPRQKTAVIRVCAGISYALTEAMDEGHCGLPAEELTPLAVELLERT